MKSKQIRREDLAILLEEMESDPVFFATTILGHDYWWLQAEIAGAMARPRARVAVKGCHASSKTFVAADLLLWWTLTGGIGVTTSATLEQVKRLVWAEIHKSYRDALFPLGGKLFQTEYRIGADCWAIGVATTESVRLQGYHGNVMIVIDEAPGVRGDIWEAVEGIRAGGDVRVLSLGNPVVPSGPFYDIFTRGRASWATFTIGAFNTPNLAGLGLAELLALPEAELDIAPRPYLIGRRYVKEKYFEVGEGSPIWQARILGQFPDQAEDSLIPLSWLEGARTASAPPAPDEVWEAGIDVAGPGKDETTLVVRRGCHVVLIRSWSDSDPLGPLLGALDHYRDRISAIKVDSIGIGYYFAKRIEAAGWAGKVRYVDVAKAPRAKERFENLKAELYWQLRQRFEDGDVTNLTDDPTIAQLAGIRYNYNTAGKVVIESKADARRRGVKSPDRAEAVMLAFATNLKPRGGRIVSALSFDHVPHSRRTDGYLVRQWLFH
jgi:phage terminase large subunit